MDAGEQRCWATRCTARRQTTQRFGDNLGGCNGRIGGYLQRRRWFGAGDAPAVDGKAGEVEFSCSWRARKKARRCGVIGRHGTHPGRPCLEESDRIANSLAHSESSFRSCIRSCSGDSHLRAVSAGRPR